MKKLIPWMLIISLILNGIFISIIVTFSVEFNKEIRQRITNKTKCNIVMYGNSLTYKGDWQKLLFRFDVRNEGQDGFTTDELKNVLQQHVISHQPKTCFLEGGINDIFQQIPLPVIEANYTSMIDTLLKHGIEPVVQSTLYVDSLPESVTNQKVDSFNIILRQICAERGLKYLNLNSLLSENKRLKPDINTDDIHLNKKGYLLWRELVKEVLKTKDF